MAGTEDWLGDPIATLAKTGWVITMATKGTPTLLADRAGKVTNSSAQGSKRHH
jgi:hypothetical protein